MVFLVVTFLVVVVVVVEVVVVVVVVVVVSGSCDGRLLSQVIVNFNFVLLVQASFIGMYDLDLKLRFAIETFNPKSELK